MIIEMSGRVSRAMSRLKEWMSVNGPTGVKIRKKLWTRVRVRNGCHVTGKLRGS